MKMLLLGVYGMEVVECGGVLAKNVQAGGKSYASIMISRPQTQPQIKEAASILGVEMTFANFKSGEVEVTPEAKKRLIKVIRETKPDIIITQDPEHSFRDLDPDRRLAMILILESIALAGRDYALDEMPGLEPHPIPTIYYMTPDRPNCIVDIAEVYDLKEKGMDVLISQMEFSGRYYQRNYGDGVMEKIVHQWSSLTTDYERGREGHRQIDRAVHLYQGACGHGKYALSEAYRREGKFHLENLIV